MIEASTTTTIVTSILGSAVGIITILGLMIGFMFRSMNIQFTHTNTRIDDTNRRIDETNNRLQRVETRVDEIDRTGKLEGTLSTFIQNQGKVEAA